MTTDIPKSKRKRKIIKALLCAKMPLVFRMMARAALLTVNTTMFSRNQARKWVIGCTPIIRRYYQKENKPKVLSTDCNFRKSLDLLERIVLSAVQVFSDATGSLKRSF